MSHDQTTRPEFEPFRQHRTQCPVLHRSQVPEHNGSAFPLTRIGDLTNYCGQHVYFLWSNIECGRADSAQINYLTPSILNHLCFLYQISKAVYFENKHFLRNPRPTRTICLTELAVLAMTKVYSSQLPSVAWVSFSSVHDVEFESDNCSL